MENALMVSTFTKTSSKLEYLETTIGRAKNFPLTTSLKPFFRFPLLIRHPIQIDLRAFLSGVVKSGGKSALYGASLK